jgi:hypothetical protein
MPARCPPGMVCFQNTTSWSTVIIVVSALLIVGIVLSSRNANILQHNEQQHQQQRQEQQQLQQQPLQINLSSRSEGGDDRYTRSPEAERIWNAPPDYSRIPSPIAPFNIPTQGIPESYQSMGIIKTPDGKLLPLYGRRSVSSRERYNYYTRTDTYNPIPIPVIMKGRDCQDQVGCPELYNGDRVKLSATNESGEVTIYRVKDLVY